VNDHLPISFLIAAQTRLAAQEGVSIIVRRRGYESSGAIILKINRLDGTSHVLAQVRMGDETVWSPISRADPLPEAEAEQLLEKQVRIDPDSWIVEIEDKQGRHWFPGRVAKL
jgi:hypothetical protein